MDDGVTKTKAIVITRDIDGNEIDVTTGVQALYDLVINSMDWGSGFLSLEDVIPISEIARICGFEQLKEIDEYIKEREALEATRIVKGDRYKKW